MVTISSSRNKDRAKLFDKLTQGKHPRYRGDIEAEFRIYGMDIAQGQVYQLQKTILPNLRYAIQQGGEQVKEEILKSYYEAQGTTRFNTVATIAAKGDIRRLYETGSLEAALLKMKVNIVATTNEVRADVEWDPPEAGTDTFYEGQTRSNPRYLYFFSSELGARAYSWKFGVPVWGRFKVPRRAFFKKGLQAGYRRMFKTVQADLLAWWKFYAKPPTHLKLPNPNFEREFNLTGWDMLMVSLPPSQIYSYIGMAADAESLASGGFTMPNIDAFLMSMAKGRVGGTKKVQRRNLRRRLWY